MGVMYRLPLYVCVRHVILVVKKNRLKIKTRTLAQGLSHKSHPPKANGCYQTSRHKLILTQSQTDTIERADIGLHKRKAERTDYQTGRHRLTPSLNGLTDTKFEL